VSKITDVEGKKQWKCGWCGNDFATWNATAIAHVSRMKGRDVKLRNERIDKKHEKRYTSLAIKMLKKKERSHEHHSDVEMSIDQHNHNTAVSLDATRRNRSSTSKRICKTAPTACTIDYCTPPEADSAVSSLTKGNKEMIKVKIHDGPNPSAESV
jgi:hypothetical protein